ncbi:hypothetical protein NQ317_018230 [Molorchus minor]|uniref:RNase H type-1 domain-containing protein n=1 Tax=Molorchus minor TaxID=1323400 RepID=A0ABQ9K3L6_9CUCU|nr:hypothetical protein NQ317_018230 [Molorchus minor]
MLVFCCISWSAKRINPDGKTSDECDDDMAIGMHIQRFHHGQGRANHSSQSNPNRQVWDDKRQVICQTESSDLRMALKLVIWQERGSTACGLENLKKAPKGRTIQICSDSRAALLAIESSKVKSRLVLKCKKSLNNLASRNKVILTWVPGHSGVRGNEEADRLAREGSAMYPIGPEPILGVPYSMGV